jgi:prepilin-type N-terminal cleavage/methylation domain-containing protein
MRRAFTLIEIIVVMAIICVLAALLMPVFIASKQAAFKAAALSEMRQLGMASIMYQGEWDDRLVPSSNYGVGEDKPERVWHNQLLNYAKERKAFRAAGTSGRFVFVKPFELPARAADSFSTGPSGGGRASD